MKSGLDKAAPIPAEPMHRLAVANGWRLVVLFGSAARGEPAPRDLDFAVLPGGRALPDLITQGRWQAQLEDVYAPMPVDSLKD